MDEHELEQVMVDFVAHKFDLLVATTIVKSGLDIPNANTILIDEADRYGLADLHQLRGRVGRYKHRAYCYLLVDPHKHVSPNAARRLRAIEEFSDMGAGFAISMRDLEIRGAGNLLGSQQSGHIVITVSDDGRGLNREKLLAKARQNGLPCSESMSDAEVFQLIFLPGFSTADQVTDVSGRGVGMDVVKKNIQSLGGTVELTSTPGKGTAFTIRLPLTLAILDGMSVAVGGEIFFLPLSTVVESMQPQSDQIKRVINNGTVIRVRSEYLQVVDLRGWFALSGPVRELTDSIVVIVESEGRKLALQVDDLVGQQQVVIKSLEANYRRVPGMSGATISGDGRVALILDVVELVREATRPAAA